MSRPSLVVDKCEWIFYADELEAELADTVTECLAAKSNEDIMRKQLADRTEEWSKYCGKLNELLAEAYDTFRETYAELSTLREAAQDYYECQDLVSWVQDVDGIKQAAEKALLVALKEQDK